MKKATETGLVKAIIDALNYLGCTVWRQNQGAIVLESKGRTRMVRFCSRKGISDVGGFTPEGFHIAIEVKLPGKKGTPDQIRYIDAVQSTTYGVAGIVFSVEGAIALVQNRRRPASGEEENEY